MKSVIWITGLSGSGKTTLAKCLVGKIKQQNINVVHLDGDELRSAMLVEKNYSRDARLRLSYIYSNLAKLISNQNNCVVVSVIAMFEEIYKYNKDSLDNYLEVYLNFDLQTRINRDYKGVYTSEDLNFQNNIAGSGLVIDEPINSHLVFSDPDLNPTVIADKILTIFFHKIGLTNEN
jgi:adenylylsulfate kinase-like enzyme